MKRKVLYVITKSNWGGAQRYVFDLATNLPPEKFSVAVACGGSGRLVQKLKEKNVRVLPVPSFQRDIAVFKEFAVFGELLKIFKTERPDAVHLNSSKAGGLGALAARIAGVPKIIFTSHGLAWDEDRNIFAKMAIYLLSQLTFALCHKVITISKDTHRRVSKSVLIYNGIQKIDFREREEARRKIVGQVIKDTPWIGTLGEFTRNKGYTYLIQAASLLKKRRIAFRMSLVGNGEDLPEIKRQAIESGLYSNPGSSAYIDLPGFRPDYARNLKAFEIFVLASVKEGLPYVLLEAGQAGCAVVGSRIPGIIDVVGEAGILVEPKNPVALAEALEQLFKDRTLRQTLGKKLQERVQKDFSLEHMVQKTIALYQS